ncbi:unnamed protein product [Amoebophrya sp. A25]|nr:unnamed protein product [Amoebophrya sp. A25]|eukprot:GSA25T00016084001.1
MTAIISGVYAPGSSCWIFKSVQAFKTCARMKNGLDDDHRKPLTCRAFLLCLAAVWLRTSIRILLDLNGVAMRNAPSAE